MGARKNLLSETFLLTTQNMGNKIFLNYAKSSKFGHQVNLDTYNVFANSVNPDETAPYEPCHQDFHCLLS